MNRRTDFDGENKGTDANQADVLSGSGRRLDSVIPFPFPRRTEAAASEGSAGCSETSSGHPFIPLGTAVAAVIMRLGSSRLRAFGPVSVGAGGKDRADDDGSMGG